MNEEIVKQLALKLADVSKEGLFITTVFRHLDSDKKRQQMLEFISNSEKRLTKSDIYVKDMQINGKIDENI